MNEQDDFSNKKRNQSVESTKKINSIKIVLLCFWLKSLI